MAHSGYYLVYMPEDNYYCVAHIDYETSKGQEGEEYLQVFAKFTQKSDARAFMKMKEEEDADAKKAVPF